MIRNDDDGDEDDDDDDNRNCSCNDGSDSSCESKRFCLPVCNQRLGPS